MSNKKEFKRDNHFVSECYLNMWKGKLNKVYVCKKYIPRENYRLWTDKYPSQIGKIKNFYVRYDGEKETDDFEDLFSLGFENKLSIILKKIDNQENLTEEDKVVLYKFIATQRYKTIDGLSRIKSINERNLPNIMTNEIENFKFNPNSPKIESDLGEFLPIKIDFEKVDEKSTNVVATAINGKSLWLMGLKRLLLNGDKMLSNHKWIFIKAPAKKFWYTSDNPVITLNFNNENDYNFLGGFGSKGSNIIVPISPKILMLTQIGTDFTTFEVASEEFYNLIQKLICENATNCVYSCVEDANIVKYMNRKVNLEIFNLYETYGLKLFEEYNNVEVPLIKKR